MSMDGQGSKLYAILVTYRRNTELMTTLAKIADQTRQPDRLILIDNASNPRTETVAMLASDGFAAPPVYISMPENVGYTGGVRAGMIRLLEIADDEDWIVVCDDDDPPRSRDAFADLVRFAEEMLKRDPRTAGVGFGGGRFDFRRGQIVRVPTDELHGPVPLDYIGGNSFGCYRVGALRDVGPWSADIFFGFSEGEFGLRLGRAGYVLWGDGDTWRERRIADGRADHVMSPRRRLPPVGWRRYYSLRNVIWILRQHGRTGVALRVSLVRGIGKPLANLPLTPRVAIRHLRINARAIRDAWTNRMGRRVEPIPWGRRPDETEIVPSILDRVRSEIDALRLD